MSLDDHSHCDTCIRIKCTSDAGCQIVSCDHDCGAIFHWCKKTDHVNFCPNVRVPCINQFYGCPQELVRHEMNSHLALCPASVVCCTVEWNRWPIYSKERMAVVPGKRTNNHARCGQLDVAMALRDQRLLNDAMKVPRRLRKTLKNKLHPRFPAVPLVHAPQNMASIDDLAVETEQVSFSPAADSTTPEKCVQNDDHGSPQVNESANSPKSEIPIPPGPPPSLNDKISLDLTVESITKYQMKPDSMYTFMCLQVFQRVDYPWHVKNMHSEIFGGLNGWLQQRCPLASYGCTHTINRLCPNTKGSKIVYSPGLESFGVQPFMPDHLKPENCTNTSRNLTELPFDVLEQIAENLDGFSLNNLALTCVTLQNVCLNLLQKKGVVLLQWQKDTDGNKPKWYIDGTVWMFPNSVMPIRTWVNDDFFSMADHLQECPYNKKNIRTEPIKVMPEENSDTTTIQDKSYRTGGRWVISAVSQNPDDQPIWTFEPQLKH